MQRSIRFKVEGCSVLMILNGVLVAEFPFDKALEVAEALKVVAKTAEQNNKPVMDRQIQEQAMLMRSGFMPGFSLSGNPVVIENAKTEAQWNRTLRKSMPVGAGAKLDVKWGLPQVKNGANNETP